MIASSPFVLPINDTNSTAIHLRHIMDYQNSANSNSSRLNRNNCCYFEKTQNIKSMHIPEGSFFTKQQFIRTPSRTCCQ